MTVAWNVMTLTRAHCLEQLRPLLVLLKQSCGWGEQQLLVEMPDKWNKSLVAVQVSKPLGLLIASRRLEGSIHIHEMVVDLDWRRKGVAAALMQSFVTRNHGRPLSLKVRIDNEPAIRLYSRFGFEFGEVANEYRWMRR